MTRNELQAAYGKINEARNDFVRMVIAHLKDVGEADLCNEVEGINGVQASMGGFNGDVSIMIDKVRYNNDDSLNVPLELHIVDEDMEQCDKWQPYYCIYEDISEILQYIVLDKYVSPDPFGFVEIKMDSDMAHQLHHSGACDVDTERWVNHPYFRAQLDEIPYENIVRSLEECWGDEDEVHNADRRTNEKRLLWLSAAEWVEEHEC